MKLYIHLYVVLQGSTNISHLIQTRVYDRRYTQPAIKSYLEDLFQSFRRLRFELILPAELHC